MKLSVSQQLDLVDESIQKWEGKKGIYQPKTPQSIEHIEHLLDMSSEDRGKMSSEECLESAITLNHYCLYINRVSQAEYSNGIWAKERLERLTARRSDSYNGFTWQERVAKVVASEGLELDQKRIECEMRSLRLKDMTKWIGEIARSFQILGQSKKGR